MAEGISGVRSSRIMGRGDGLEGGTNKKTGIAPGFCPAVKRPAYDLSEEGLMLGTTTFSAERRNALGCTAPPP